MAKQGDGAGSQVYPYADAPNILRANEKDNQVQSILHTTLLEPLRRLLGPRLLQKHSEEIKTITDLFYYGLTTVRGTRTLGEEYCDVVLVHPGSRRPPGILRRLGYVISLVLGPFAASKALPKLRGRLLEWLQMQESKLSQPMETGSTKPQGLRAQALNYAIEHLNSIVSPAPLYTIGLVLFYFSGAYHQLSKRLFSLRYILTRAKPPDEQSTTYEVLGFLLLAQVVIQSARQAMLLLSSAHKSGGLAASLDDIIIRKSTPATQDGQQSPKRADTDEQAKSHMKDYLSTYTTTHIDLADEKSLAWLTDNSRKCTLCLTTIVDPAINTCGHMFCWICIRDWAREKPECPLCRQACTPQHLLPLAA